MTSTAWLSGSLIRTEGYWSRGIMISATRFIPTVFPGIDSAMDVTTPSFA